MSNLLDWFGKFFSSDVGIGILSSVIPLLVSLVVLIIRLIASKIKNKNIRKLIEILPDAMEFAESSGQKGSIKLDLALSYIKDAIKNLSDEIITEYIEKAITISKSVNVHSQEGTKSVSSRISLPNGGSK